MSSWVSSAASAIVGCAVSAVSAIAGSAASAVVEKIVDAGMSYLSNRMLPADSDDELERISTVLPQIREVMDLAEALKAKDPSSSEWFEQFRRAVDASEDVLDELEYKKLEDMVKNRDEAQAGGSASRFKKQKSCPINEDTLGRLRDAVKILDQATANVERLCRRATELGIHDVSESRKEATKVLRRETSSFPVETKVFGRDADKNKIVSWLKRPTEGLMSSLGIVGMGGLGKTTLAQFAYQEMKGSNYFDQAIWVCVSIGFSVEGITKKMFSELGNDNCGDKSLNALQEALKDKIQSVKVLLILDDVWDDENVRDWEQFFAPLKYVKQGSKILFTTRMQSVVNFLGKVVKGEYESLKLQGLGEQDLGLLFNSYAFHGINRDHHGDLRAIGDQMIKMLKGSPLAAKVIGSLLNSRPDHQFWKRILNRDSLFNIKQAKDVMEVLKLSYYHLPTNLQKIADGECCRVEPNKRIEIIPSSVRHLSVHESEIERVFHLENLRSLVITTDKNIYYPQAFVLPNKLIKKKLRLLVIYVDRTCQLPEGISCLVHLRYLSIHLPNVSGQSFKYLLHASIYKLYHLQLLELVEDYPNKSSYMEIEATRITNLVNLRYVRLPKEIMQTIGGVHKLTSLQELNFFVRKENAHHINELGTLNDLRNLSIYDIHNVGDPAEATGANLSQKKNLISLSLAWTRDNSPPNSEQIIDNLKAPFSLRNLTITNYKGQIFRGWSPLINLSTLVLEHCPNLDKFPDVPLSLIEFRVFDVGLICLPNFHQFSTNNNTSIMSQTSLLRKVEISDCSNLISLDGFLGQDNINLQAVEFLSIMNCERLVELPIQGFGNLTSLKQLKLINCPKLVIVELPENLQELEMKNCGEVDVPLLKASSSLTKLTKLEISGCANIISITVSARSLAELRISKCYGLVELFLEEAHEINQQSNFNIIEMEWIYIQDCPNLIRVSYMPLTIHPKCNTSSTLSNGKRSTTSLKSLLRNLEICRCENLIYLNVFRKFLSLARLVIIDCPMLVAVYNQSNLLPMTLESLEISNCGELVVSLLELASHLTTLTELEIRSCANITHIPCSQSSFGSLRRLCITKCDKLVEHSSRERAHDVNLLGSNFASLKINDLKIDHLSLLLIEPLRSLRFVDELNVFNCSGMEVLPEQWLLQNRGTLRSLKIFDGRSMKSLPATMANLIALEHISIHNADLLEKLPDLPASLRFLHINGAKSLKSLPATMASLTALEHLNITNADLLDELPVLPLSLRSKSIRRSDGVELLT